MSLQKKLQSYAECLLFRSTITQAIVNNFAPLLFLTFQSTYQISLDKIALLVSFNFGVQLLVDLLAARYVDRIGYRNSVVAAHIFAAIGLARTGRVSISASRCLYRIAACSALLCDWRWIDRSVDQSDRRILSNRKKSGGHESFAFFLLLGECRGYSDLYGVFCCDRD